MREATKILDYQNLDHTAIAEVKKKQRKGLTFLAIILG